MGRATDYFGKGTARKAAAGVKNVFSFESELKQIQRELDKAAREQRRKAARYFRRHLAQQIEATPFKNDSGALAKSVEVDNRRRSTLVGVSASHGLLVEYGTEGDRIGIKGDKRRIGRSSGKMPATPYFAPAFRKSLPGIQKILAEPW